MKLLAKFLGSKASQKCSKTMPKNPPIKRWDMCMKVDLKESKDKSWFPFG
jgi:ribosomal protein S26